jgi:hypothetical protein
MQEHVVPAEPSNLCECSVTRKRCRPGDSIDGGGGRGTRTPDLYSAIVALSQLSYAPTHHRMSAPRARGKVYSAAAGHVNVTGPGTGRRSNSLLYWEKIKQASRAGVTQW